MPYQECTAKESSLPVSVRTHRYMPVSKNKEFLVENLILLFWLGVPGSFSFLPRPSDPSQQKQFYLWYWMLPEKKKSPAREKWEAWLGIFKAPQYISSFFSGQKFQFTKFLQLNLSFVSFSLFPFFFLSTHLLATNHHISLIHVFN